MSGSAVNFCFICSYNTAISNTTVPVSLPNHAGAEDSEPKVEEEEPEVEEASEEDIEFESSEEENDRNKDEEEVDETMPPKIKKKGKTARKSAPTDLGTLTESMGKLKVRGGGATKDDEVYDFDNKACVMKKGYCKNDVDK